MQYNSYAKLVIAYSGGLDSHVLLHQLAQDENVRTKLHVVYINHGLSSNSDLWQQHCSQICEQLDVPFTAIKINVAPKVGESLEAVARDQRYAELAKFMTQDTALLTAQHQDDQAETLLLQLIRGAGVKGLAAMPMQKSFADGVHLRPLLNVTRAELLCYAQQHNLQWVEDESNQNLTLNRNYLRQTIMPLLKQRWPSVAATLARSSQHCAEAVELINELAQSDYQLCVDKQLVQLNIQALKNLSRARQKNVLRYWLQLNGIRAPNQIHLEKIIDEVIAAKSGAKPQLRWENIIIEREQGALQLKKF